jgi:tetratricopeptide (TPR) repeat protein
MRFWKKPHRKLLHVFLPEQRFLQVLFCFLDAAILLVADKDFIIMTVHLSFEDQCAQLRAGTPTVLSDSPQPLSERALWEHLYIHAWSQVFFNGWDATIPWLVRPEVPGAEVYLVEDVDPLTLLGQTWRRRQPALCLLLGNLASQLGRLEEAFAHYQVCLDFLDERRMDEPALRFETLCAMGANAYSMRSFQLSAIHYQAALDLHLSDPEGAVTPLAGLSMVHQRLKHYEQALTFGLQAWELASFYPFQCELALQVGEVYECLGAHTSASEFYRKARLLAQKQELSLSSSIRLASCLLKQGELAEAERVCLSLLETGDSESSGHLVLLCGQLAQAREEWSPAVEYYQRAITLLTEDRPALASAYRHLAAVWEATGQVTKALDLLKRAFQEE